ncbi:MAG: hypothetical protein JJ975_12780 [Bacteroidia bacterium]|nr:hypothetical protein [Bacteroidia bacterium]
MLWSNEKIENLKQRLIRVYLKISEVDTYRNLPRAHGYPTGKDFTENLSELLKEFYGKSKPISKGAPKSRPGFSIKTLKKLFSGEFVEHRILGNIEGVLSYIETSYHVNVAHNINGTGGKKVDSFKKELSTPIPEHTSTVYRGLRIYDAHYWYLQSNLPLSQTEIDQFYFHDFSPLAVLQKVIANDEHVAPVFDLHGDYEDDSVDIFDEIDYVEFHSEHAVYFLHGGAGSGKTTLLLHLSKIWQDRFSVIHVLNISLINDLPFFIDKHVVLFIDGYSSYSTSEISQLLETIRLHIQQSQFKRGVTFILLEQTSKVSGKKVQDFKAVFDHSGFIRWVEVLNLSFRSLFYENLFTKLSKLLGIGASNQNQFLHDQFLSKTTSNVSQRIYWLFSKVVGDRTLYNNKIKHQWDYWEELCGMNDRLNGLEGLYEMVAILNHFNTRPSLRFCLEYLHMESRWHLLVGLFNTNLPIVYSETERYLLVIPNSDAYKRMREIRQLTEDQLYQTLDKIFLLAFSDASKPENVHIVRNLWRNLEISEQWRSQIKLAEVIEYFNKARCNKRDFAKNYMELSIALSMNDEPKRSIEILEELVKVENSQNSYIGLTKLAKTYLDINEPTKALPIVKKLTRNRLDEFPVVKLVTRFYNSTIVDWGSYRTKIEELIDFCTNPWSKSYLITGLSLRSQSESELEYVSQLYKDFLDGIEKGNINLYVQATKFFVRVKNSHFTDLVDLISQNARHPKLISYFSGWLVHKGFPELAVKVTETFIEKNSDLNNVAVKVAKSRAILGLMEELDPSEDVLIAQYNEEINFLLNQNLERNPNNLYTYHQLYMSCRIAYQKLRKSKYYFTGRELLKEAFKIDQFNAFINNSISEYIFDTRRPQLFMWFCDQYIDQESQNMGLSDFILWRIATLSYDFALMEKCIEQNLKRNGGNAEKFAEDYTNFIPQPHYNLVSQGQVGLYNGRYILTPEKERIPITKDPIFKYVSDLAMPSEGLSFVRVFYSKYLDVSDNIVANCIEPYFMDKSYGLDELVELILPV